MSRPRHVDFLLETVRARPRRPMPAGGRQQAERGRACAALARRLDDKRAALDQLGGLLDQEPEK